MFTHNSRQRQNMFRFIASILLFTSFTYAAAPVFKSSRITDGPNPQLLYAVDVPLSGETSTTLDGSSFDNCRQITENFNFHWAVRDGMFKAAHEGFAEDGVYFSFGIVADPNAANRMAGADGVVTSFDVNTNEAMAEDYFMNAVSPCDPATGMGVCPDSIITPNDPDANLVFNVTGFHQEGIHVVSYVRPLVGTDANDITLDADAALMFIFAQGPMSADGLPMFHNANRGAIELVLNRDPTFQCTTLQPNVEGPPDMGGDDDSSASMAKPEILVAAVLLGAALL